MQASSGILKGLNLSLRGSFTQLVDLYYESLWAYTASLVAGSEAADDLVHDAFLVAFEYLAQGREFSGDPEKWLRGVVRNIVHAWWRKNRKFPPAVAERLKAGAGEEETSLAALEKAEEEEALTRCLDKLGDEDRTLIGKRYTQRFRATRLAREMGININTLRVRLFRVRKWLKACVEMQSAGEGRA